MLSLDHVVIYNPTPEKVQENENLIIKEGGHHKNWGTYNYLAYMQDSYIEWIGIEDAKKAEQSNNPFIQHVVYANKKEQNGLIQFALQTNEMDKIIKNLNKNKISYKGPFPGSRTKPNGKQLKWRMLFPTFDYKQEVLPFLIEWEGSGNTPDEQKDINNQKLESISVGVENIKDTVYQWESIYPFPKKMERNKKHIHFPLQTGFIELHQGKGLKVNYSKHTFHS